MFILSIIDNQCVHLVPETEEAWFDANKMYHYSLGNMAAGINAHTNAISLRDDVRRCFDSNAFVFYPAGHGDAFMAYFVSEGGYPDYTELFHRRLVTIHPSVAVEFLYARFAYTVIKIFRCNVFFDSVEGNEEVRKIAEQKLLKKLEKQAHRGLNGSEASELEHSQASDGNEESDMGRYRCFRGAFSYSYTIYRLLLCLELHQPVSPTRILCGRRRAVEGRAVQAAAGYRYAFLSHTTFQYALVSSFRYSHGIHPASLEEVEHPPDTVACHTETPHMLRLMSKYMKDNPQVWQTSSTPEGTMRNDVQDFYARWITRPSGT